YILALKILAGRRRDRADIRALCQQLGVSTRADAQRIIDTYITDQQIMGLNHVDSTLARLFP
ncbi:MAG TPA: hypothetical protein VMV29_20615, partial [Ktedonobacterales bacterium]|nr:hypothetical protein [Ktedonobacterales bacterium]